MNKTRRVPPREKRYIDLKSQQVDILVARDKAVRAKDFDSVLDLLADRFQIEISLEQLEFDKRMECGLGL